LGVDHASQCKPRRLPAVLRREVAHAPDRVEADADIGRHLDRHDIATAIDDATVIALGDGADALGAGVEMVMRKIDLDPPDTRRWAHLHLRDHAAAG
jgi:hypothetical protein